MKVGENFIQHTCSRLERGQEKSACRVCFILVLHVNIVVIQPFRKADYGSASLKFAILDTLFPFKSNRPQNSNSSKIHLIGVDIVLQILPYSIN